MKTKTLVLIFLFFTVTVMKSFSQMESNDVKNNDSLLMNSFKRHLKGAMVFNTVINCLEITGTPFFAAGVIKNSDVMAIGFLIGFPGMEMSKYTPIPLTKAKKELIRLKPVWRDPASYSLLTQQVSAAKGLSYATMATAFIAEGMFLAGLFSPHPSTTNGWIVSSSICAGTSFCLAICTTVMTSMAWKTYSKHTAAIELSLTDSGIGAIYHLP
jgi:hypothetical protein